jgi:hypothetical protein
MKGCRYTEEQVRWSAGKTAVSEERQSSSLRA